LQRVVGALAPQVVGREASQLIVDEREQRVNGVVVAPAEFEQQLRYAFRLGLGHVADFRLWKIPGAGGSINKIYAPEN
jgi:hypothetical protein